MTPIVRSIGSSTQKLVKFLVKHLQPYAEDDESYVKNASHFIKHIKDITPEPGQLLVSFDVVLHFTDIPVDEALDIIRNIQTCRRNTTISYVSNYERFGDKGHRDDNLKTKIMATLR